MPQPDTRFTQETLQEADLVVDAVYQGGRRGNAGDDPLSSMLGVSNQGGFRHLGSRGRPHLLVITTSMNQPDWPDHLDLETGLFTYIGDNRKPGRDLHGTPRWGNEMLRDLFERSHGIGRGRAEVPPVLVFRTAGTYRDVRFLGIAVPGAAGLPATEDLVATWHHSSGQRFQNYRAIFTILDVPRLSRAWLNDIRADNARSANAPDVWHEWTIGGRAQPLRSSTTVHVRNKAEQLPDNPIDWQILKTVYETYHGRPHHFEVCAAQIAELMLPSIAGTDLTRPSRDGGRDAIGKYRIGIGANAIDVEFALEAKCFGPSNSVGVKETSRLISRLRHRQFGILVTTSFVNSQAYSEIREDGHPVLVVSGADIAMLFRRSGMRHPEEVRRWLSGISPM